VLFVVLLLLVTAMALRNFALSTAVAHGPVPVPPDPWFVAHGPVPVPPDPWHGPVPVPPTPWDR